MIEILSFAVMLTYPAPNAHAFVVAPFTQLQSAKSTLLPSAKFNSATMLRMSDSVDPLPKNDQDTTTATAISSSANSVIKDYEEPEDPVIHIKPPAMNRLRELKAKQSNDSTLVLRMGVRNGGCSGLSYVMDFSSESEIQEEDAVDEYMKEGIKCVVDSKSMLYLYGLELDYSDELIGGGFKFFNPNAEESCGCGSSFGV